MRRLLLTGGTGFLGSWILKALNSPEFSEKLDFDIIRLFVRNPEKTREFKNDRYKYEIIQGDFTNPKSITKASQDVDATIHVAALFDTMSSDWMKFKEINVDGTKYLLENLERGTKFILTSTVGVYGLPNLKTPIKEDYEPKQPIGAYQKSKKMQEDLAREMCKEKDINFVAIRPAGIIGPGDYFVVPTMIENILSKRMVLSKGGKNITSIVHPSDAANVHLKALNYDGHHGDAFHVASFHTTLKEYVTAYCHELNVEPIKRNIPYSILYTLGVLAEILPIKSDFNRFNIKYLYSDFILDLTNITTYLNYTPEYDLERTIRESVQWYQQEKPQKRV